MAKRSASGMATALAGPLTGLLVVAWVLHPLILDVLGVLRLASAWPVSLEWVLELPHRHGALISNFCLLVTAAGLVLALPRLVLDRGRRSHELLRRILALIGLALLGSAAVRVLAPGWSDHASSALLASTWVLCGVTILTSPTAPGPRVAGAAAAAALSVPHLWRLTFSLAGGGWAADSLRGLADLAIPGAVVALGALSLARLPRRGVIVGVILASSYLAVRLAWPLATNEICRAVTDLWLTTLPDAGQIVLLMLVAFALGAMPFSRRTGGAFLAVAFTVASGVMPERNEALLANYLAALTLLAWAQGIVVRVRDLPALFA